MSETRFAYIDLFNFSLRLLPQCTMGNLIMCASSTEGGQPQLLFSAGYGEWIGGGFGGKSVEVEDNICRLLKEAGLEGKLLPSEFLACLLYAAVAVKDSIFARDSFLKDLADCVEGGPNHEDNPDMPILSKACKMLAPDWQA